LMYCRQTVWWIKMKLGTQVGLGPGHIVLATQSSAHVYCGQTTGWMKTPLGTGVDLSQGHIVLDGDPAPPRERGTAAPPPFRPMSIVATVAHLSYC